MTIVTQFIRYPTLSDIKNAYRDAEAWFYRYIAKDAASLEAVSSQLPGREDGPADAYRHLLWSGELTRRFGAPIARLFLDGHELQGRYNDWGGGDRQSDAAEKMDRDNNEIGILIGKNAKTWSDVIAQSQGVMDGSERSGNGGDGQARWLESKQWHKDPVIGRSNIPAPQNWPKTDWIKGQVRTPYDYSQGNDYPWGNEDSGVLSWVEKRIGLNEDDVKKLMSLDTYRNNWDPFYKGTRALVDHHFESLFGSDENQDDGGYWDP